MNRVLFDDDPEDGSAIALSGDDTDYYNPDNSRIDQVSSATRPVGCGFLRCLPHALISFVLVGALGHFARKGQPYHHVCNLHGGGTAAGAKDRGRECPCAFHV